MSEHRNQRRVEAQTLVSIEYVDPEGIETQFMARSLDLSETGIQLELSRTYPAYTVLTLNLCIGEEILRIKGRVVHQKSSEDRRIALGVHFLDLHEEDRKKIQAYVAKKQ